MERIGDEVGRELARSGGQEGTPLAAVTAAWPSAVGDTIARKAWPRRLARDGTLHVATESATWAHELALLAEDVLGRLQSRLGEEAPAQLRFAVGPIPEPAASPRPPAEPLRSLPEAPPEIESEALAAAAAIDDPELRELVAKAARASLLKARSGRHFW